jgi:hypothetical protein
MQPDEQPDLVLTFSVVKQWLVWPIAVTILNRQSAESYLRKTGDSKANILAIRNIEAPYVGMLDVLTLIVCVIQRTGEVRTYISRA